MRWRVVQRPFESWRDGVPEAGKGGAEPNAWRQSTEPGGLGPTATSWRQEHVEVKRRKTVSKETALIRTGRKREEPLCASTAGNGFGYWLRFFGPL